MNIDLIPQPKSLRTLDGHLSLPRKGFIGISDHSLSDVADLAKTLFKGHAIAVGSHGLGDSLSFSLDPELKPGGYKLSIRKGGVSIAAASVAAAFHAWQTLRQIAAQSPNGTLPFLTINDWPDFLERGVYYDVCRGRVPKLERLLELADLLSAYKINHLQLYIEHTFVFRDHPDIGKGASPLSPEDILTLDAYCRERHIELVPSLAAFGHLATVLKHKQYHHLAEDLGVGHYVDPEAAKHRCIKGWTLSPANPKIYDFLDSLFAEFLPLFSSTRFNVCCDETWDLGLGQSYDLCKKKGKGRVYIDHIKKLNKIVKRHGKRIMFWGDIIRHHPELIQEIPRDVTVLDWGYSSKMDFDRITDFVNTGLATYVCPSVCGYVTLFPRLHESAQNIAGWAKAGAKRGAIGMLNTDWGDGGHYNFTECAWYGYLVGAEQSWNAKADLDSFPERFCKLFVNARGPAMAKALVELGDISHLSCAGFYQSIWQHVFFARPGDSVLALSEVEASVCAETRIASETIALDAKLGNRTLRRLTAIRKVLAAEARQKGVDPLGLLPYWLFAVDTMAHAARKLTVVGPGGKDTPAARRALRTEMTELMARFRKLWLARNRTSEIRFTLKRYQAAIDAL